MNLDEITKLRDEVIAKKMASKYQINGTNPSQERIIRIPEGELLLTADCTHLAVRTIVDHLAKFVKNSSLKDAKFVDRETDIEYYVPVKNYRIVFLPYIFVNNNPHNTDIDNVTIVDDIVNMNVSFEAITSDGIVISEFDYSKKFYTNNLIPHRFLVSYTDFFNELENLGFTVDAPNFKEYANKTIETFYDKTLNDTIIWESNFITQADRNKQN